MSETIKKRKWDQADQSQDDAGASPTAKQTKLDESADPSKAVSEAAARINAMLAQKGISIEDEKEPSKAPEAGEFVKDIPINELKNRYMLTRGATQAQIQRETGADVTTRGKYYPDMQLASDKEPPLYLHVSAKDQESLDKAIQQIEELIETSQVPLPGTGYPPRDNNNDMKQQQQHQRPERKFHEKKLPVDIPGNPPFNLRAKIVGPHGAYVKHIQQETGSRVQLKGRGSGFYESSTGVESEEPLHVHISCIREEGLDAAVKLTQDLIDTVKAEAERAPQYGYNRGGYNNVGNRGGYNGYANYNYSSPGSSASPATSAPADAYNYDYNQQYYDYYGQQQQQQYQYDPNSYYNYYDYSAVPVTSAPGATAAAPPPPPSSSPPPPPPPASSTALPPPPPPTSSSPLPPPPPPPPSE